MTVEKLSDEDKNAAFDQAFLYASISGVLEALPFAGMGVSQKVATSALKKAVTAVPSAALKQALIEGGTETAQQFAQNAIAKYGGADPKRDLTQGLKESFYGGAVTGLAFGAGDAMMNTPVMSAKEINRSSQTAKLIY